VATFRGMLVQEYGTPPQEAENLFTLARIRLLAAELGAKSVEVNRDELRIVAPISDQAFLDELPKLNASYDKRRHVISVSLAQKTAYGENVAKAAEAFIRAILFDVGLS